jgi:CRISPR-associated protein Csm3
MERKIQLKGRLFITFDIQTLTGLHIGGSDTKIGIGGVDKTVIRDPITNRPYIPGSSLKGKMRSLLEKYYGLEQNQRIGDGFIHSCQDSDEKTYPDCPVCPVFGLPGERKFATPTRLVVRDVHLSEASAAELSAAARTDLPFTEVKTEVSIDRVTSAANPRQMERVPAGVVFGGTRTVSPNGQEKKVPQPAELVYTIYEGEGCDPGKDVDNLRNLVTGLRLLEDDYLGGLGSRGAGKVSLSGIQVRLRAGADYLVEEKTLAGPFDSLAELTGKLDDIQKEVKKALGIA